MAFTYGFYDAVNGDRKYNAIQMSSMFDGIIQDGIFFSIGDKMMVRSAVGMMVTVGSGRAWFNHTWSLCDAELPIVVDQSEVVQDRIDTVILDVNSENRTNSIKIVKGVPSSTNPQKPNLMRSQKHNQYPLCDIFIARGVTTISQNNITNRIGIDTPFAVAMTDLASITPTDFIIRIEDWVISNRYSQYDRQASISIPNIKTEDLVRAEFDLESLISLQDMSTVTFSSVGDIYENEAVFYANGTPTKDLHGKYVIFKGMA